MDNSHSLPDLPVGAFALNIRPLGICQRGLHKFGQQVLGLWWLASCSLAASLASQGTTVAAAIGRWNANSARADANAQGIVTGSAATADATVADRLQER